MMLPWQNVVSPSTKKTPIIRSPRKDLKFPEGNHTRYSPQQKASVSVSPNLFRSPRCHDQNAS
jgi:hypothetical protein